MTDNEQAQSPKPDTNLIRLGEALLGTWKVSGSTISGQITYEWLEGGFFLMQHFDLLHDGHQNKGIEMIGRERGFGATEPSADIKSRIYDAEGNTFEYVYELEGDTLTIWGGEKGSPAYFKGTFSADGNSNTGAWHWPGGGYESNMTRVK